MRSFLYLSPYFPPDTRVGALRPLKFARHLPALGFRPIVLADRSPGPSDPRLLGALPAEVVVVHDYGLGSRAKARGAAARPSRPSLARAVSKPLFDAVLSRAREPELVPLGPHALDIPYALYSASRLIEQHGCDRILVNADPFAAAVAGALLAKRHGLPLVVDFRDPWALCELRRPLRRPWVDKSTLALERFVVQAASRVILNTERTRETYTRHYADLDAERFVCVPNHADPSLADEGPRRLGQRSSRFTLLVAGSLRRFVDGAVLLELLQSLAERGLGPRQVGLTVVGHASEAFLAEAVKHRVADYVSLQQPVSYLDVPELQAQADVLVILGHRDQQRIPAKLYDAAISERPLLVVSENEELEGLCNTIGGARVFAHADIAGMTEWVLELSRRESPQRVERGFSWNSRRASERLAEILEQAVA